MNFGRERKAVLICQVLILLMACCLQIIISNERRSFENGVLTHLYSMYGALLFFVVAMCLFSVYWIVKKRARFMPAILIQCLGLWWAMYSHHLRLQMITTIEVFSSLLLWRYYVSVAVAVIYIAICRMVLNKRSARNQAQRERTVE